MTTVVAIVTDDKVMIGSDSGSSTSRLIFNNRGPKFVKKGHWMFGYTGNGIMMNFMHEISEEDMLPYLDHDMSHLRRIVEKYFVPKRQIVKSRENDEALNWQMVAVTFGHIFEIENDGGVFEVATMGDDDVSFFAVGSGRYYALGALDAMYRSGRKFNPAKAMERALEAAARFDPWTQGPFHTETMEGGDDE